MKREKYSKYLFYWHGRFQVPKQRPNVEVVKDWLNRGMGRPDSRTNLLKEEGNEEIKRDSARLTQLEIERSMRLNKAPKEKLKGQPRKVKFEDEWDSGVTNGRHGGEVRESQVRDKENMEEGKPRAKSKSKYIFWRTKSIEREEKRAISKLPLENKPKTDEIEKIEVTAEEGELWVESLITSLQEEEDEEVRQEDLVQVQDIMHETPRIANDTNDVIPEKEEDIQVERLCLKILKIEHIDFIGVDKCDFHPNYQLVNFFNKLRKFELSYGKKLNEFRFAKSVKHRKDSKYLFSWHGIFELF
ncbi:hypothetical protein LguiB_031988 [Lonicera macranthoides]